MVFLQRLSKRDLGDQTIQKTNQSLKQKHAACVKARELTIIERG